MPARHSSCLECKNGLLVSGISQLVLPLSHKTFWFTIVLISIFVLDELGLICWQVKTILTQIDTETADVGLLMKDFLSQLH